MFARLLLPFNQRNASRTWKAIAQAIAKHTKKRRNEEMDELNKKLDDLYNKVIELESKVKLLVFFEELRQQEKKE